MQSAELERQIYKFHRKTSDFYIFSFGRQKQEYRPVPVTWVGNYDDVYTSWLIFSNRIIMT